MFDITPIAAYSNPITSQEVVGFSRSNTMRRTSADPCQAFFYVCRFPYGVQRGETSGSAGILIGRSANPALIATICLAANVAILINYRESVMSQNTSIQVAFEGTNLFVVDHNNQPYVPMRSVVEGMGMTWQSQHEKLRGSRFNTSVTEIVMQLPGDTQNRKVISLPLRKLPGWMMTVSPNKVKPEIRGKVIAFQDRCDDILWEAWNNQMQGQLSGNPEQLPHTISPAEQNAIQRIIKTKVEVEGGAFPYYWGRFNNHFKLGSYKQLPAARFEEAIEYLNQMPVKNQKALPAPEQADYHPLPLSARRWLIDYNSNGKERITEVDMNASVINLQEDLPKVIRDSSSINDDEWLLEVVRACTDRLQRRANVRTKSSLMTTPQRNQ
jgi:hypothetical protein